VEALREFENDTWWYRREIALPEDQAGADQIELVFEGVCLFATVWLNGTPVGFLHNAHHAHRIDVTRHIRREGANLLAVECGLRLDEMRKRVRSDISATVENARPYMRMCQMSFGWDFAPRLAVIGLWRPVYLACHRHATIDDIHVATRSIQGGTARLAVEARIRSFRSMPTPAALHLSIHEEPDAPPVWERCLSIAGGAAIETSLDLPAARLWYPHPAGEPSLYTLKARIECGGEETDALTTRFGVRTVELKQQGQFTFSINGVDIFARGANWVPSNSLSLDASPEQYRHLLELAHEANFNMLRVWGGGTYESDFFYDLCDELGIMVWQDFMYACAMYPDDDPEFMESAAREAREVVARLRRHPSVALWCGNNECQEAWALGDWPDHAPRHFGERLYDHVLPQVIAEFAPGVPYWPGSPYGGPTTRSRKIGDFHDWCSLPDWRAYDENAPLFSSEYGFRSVPQRETVEQMISPELQWDEHGPQHDVWRFHHGRCGWLEAVLPEFGRPKTADEYIMLTQEAQATLMRYAVEVYRRRMFATSGSLIWQYDEPWPAVTFSLVDFFGRPKAAYYWVRHAYAPVMAMFYAAAGGLSFWGVSDLLEERPCAARLRRFAHSGELLGEKVVEGRLRPNAATMLLAALPHELALQRPEHEFLHAELRCGDHSSERVYHAAHRRDWVLPPASLTASARRVDAEQVQVTLSSDGYVHFVSVSVGDPGARYSDNFVDLLPGLPRTIVIRTRDAGEITIRAANAAGCRAPVS
jgi:beta-mannosidase